MDKPYADLKLYFGLVSSDGLGEGRLNLDNRSEIYKTRCIKAKEHVENMLIRAISRKEEYDPIHLGYGFYLVESEREATKLIEHIKNNVSACYGMVELIDSSHGMIRFNRKIRFEGVSKEYDKNLKRKIMQSVKIIKKEIPPLNDGYKRDTAFYKMSLEKNLRYYCSGVNPSLALEID